MAIIMICSPTPECGKDVVADYMVSKYGYSKFCFATKVKELAKYLGWDGKKDKVGRKFIKELAQLPKLYNKNIWADMILKKITEKAKFDNSRDFVISDLRFIEELDVFSGLDDKKVIVALTRAGDDFVLDDRDVSQRDYSLFLEQEDVEVIRVHNEGTLDELYSKIDDVISYVRH